MQLVLKKGANQIKTLATLSVLVAILALGCMLFGYAFLPFAAAVYAALLIYDKKKILASVLPIPLLVINVFLNGFLSTDGIGYVLLGIVAYFFLSRDKSKAETAFWVALTSAALMILTAALVAVSEMGELSFAAVKGFYGALYHDYKEEFIKVISEIIVRVEEQPLFAFSVAEAEQLYHEIFFFAPALLMLTALAISGFMLKTLTAITVKCSGADEKIVDWRFKTPNIVAYFYIILAVTNLFAANATDTFALTVVTLSSVFSVIFAYIGVRFLFLFFAYKRGIPFAIILIGLGVLLAGGFAVVILSVIGAVVNIKMNKKPEKQ